MRAAIDVLAKRNDVDAARFGLWGYNLGGVRGASGSRRKIRGVARSGVGRLVYDYPKQMVKKIGVEKTGVGGFPFMVKIRRRMCF